MTIAMILRNFVTTEICDDGEVVVRRMELWETPRKDVDMAADFGLPRYKKGRGDVRIVLT